jgi:hypothetical protein
VSFINSIVEVYFISNVAIVDRVRWSAKDSDVKVNQATQTVLCLENLPSTRVYYSCPFNVTRGSRCKRADPEFRIR